MLLGRGHPDRGAGTGGVPDRRMAARPAGLDGQAVARSHHPVRPVAGGVRPDNTARGRVASRAGGLVGPAATYVDPAPPLTVEVLHTSRLPTRGFARRAPAQARSPDPPWTHRNGDAGRLRLRARR